MLFRAEAQDLMGLAAAGRGKRTWTASNAGPLAGYHFVPAFMGRQVDRRSRDRGCPGLHHRRAGYKDDRVAVQHEIDGGIFRDVPLG